MRGVGEIQLSELFPQFVDDAELRDVDPESEQWSEIEEDMLMSTNPELLNLFRHIVELVESGFEIRGIAKAQFTLCAQECQRRGIHTVS